MTVTKMGKSRLEINFRRLLARCEIMGKENSSDDWRLEKVNRPSNVLIFTI